MYFLARFGNVPSFSRQNLATWLPGVCPRGKSEWLFFPNTALRGTIPHQIASYVEEFYLVAVYRHFIVFPTGPSVSQFASDSASPSLSGAYGAIAASSNAPEMTIQSLLCRGPELENLHNRQGVRSVSTFSVISFSGMSLGLKREPSFSILGEPSKFLGLS